MGVVFKTKDEVFRVHMFEQVCHIRRYWLDVCEKGGRNITIDEAASEWVEQFAASFTQH